MVPSAFHWRREPAADRQRQDRPQGADGARRRARRRPSADARARRSTPTERRLAAAWATVLGIPRGPDRPARPLLRPRRHVPVGGEAGDRPGPGGVPQGRHPSPGPGRPGRAARRPAGSRPADVLLIASADRNPTMSSSLDVAARRRPAPGRPPCCAADAAGDAPGWAAEHRGRAARASSPSTARSWSAASGCATRPRSARSSGGWPRGLMAEREAFAPRQAYADGVYSSTTWPPNQPMCMHHELSYALEFPGLMLFACLTAPTDGGATARRRRADRARRAARRAGRAVRAGGLAADPQLQRRDRRVGRRGVRHRRPRRGRELLPRQRASSSRGSPTAACAPGSAAAPWSATRSPAGAAGSTRSRSSTSGRWTRRSASTWWTSTAPTGCRSTPASATATRSARTSSQLLNEVYEAHTVREPWQAGDLMLVDNIRTAHSREPFEGPREVLVGDGRPGAPGRCSPASR